MNEFYQIVWERQTFVLKVTQFELLLILILLNFRMYHIDSYA